LDEKKIVLDPARRKIDANNVNLHLKPFWAQMMGRDTDTGPKIYGTVPTIIWEASHAITAVSRAFLIEKIHVSDLFNELGPDPTESLPLTETLLCAWLYCLDYYY